MPPVRDVGGIGISGGFGSRRGRIVPLRTIDLNALMRSHAIAALDACAAPTGTADLVLETTIAEIVDVGPLKVGGDAVVEDCVREQLWRVTLEVQFAGEFARWEVQVSR